MKPAVWRLTALLKGQRTKHKSRQWFNQVMLCDICICILAMAQVKKLRLAFTNSKFSPCALHARDLVQLTPGICAFILLHWFTNLSFRQQQGLETSQESEGV